MKFDKKQKELRQPIAHIKGIPAGYVDFLINVKTQIRRGQVKASLSVNRELISLYWNIGNQILERQKQAG